MKRTIASLLLVALATVASATFAQQPRAKQSCASVSAETCKVAHELGRGVNLGNMLDSPREGDWGSKLDPAFIDLAASSFKTVRLPVRWTNHAAPTADAALDEAFAKRVDGVIDALLAKGVYVILDVHHYTQISGDPQHPNEFAVDPGLLETRLLNIWKQLGARYKDRSPKLLFELLNEPHGRLNADAWNALAAKTLAVVRQTNPSRIVLIGPVEWNAITELWNLKPPADRNVIVSIHNYDPFNFTHQGVDYLPQHFPKGTTCCDAKQRSQIELAMDRAARWNERFGWPVYLGEFGTSDETDTQSRAHYARAVRDEAESHGIGWAYWNFVPPFGLYDPKAHAWIEPIRKALLD